jgi:hypothetical protein
VPILFAATGLAGCLAVAAPLLPLIGVGMAAFSGFEMYKSIQLQGGGSVRIEFPGKDGKPSPPPPLEEFRRVAVWPSDEGNVRFAERLRSSGRFAEVVAPAAVSEILASGKVQFDLRQLTEAEQGDAFELVCRRAKVEFVFGSVARGASSNDNGFSFSRANITYIADLLGYSCTRKKIVWRDQIALIVELGSSMGNTSEMLHASGDAWADRVLTARGEVTARS